MRQLGGSFGISIINTYSARRTASHRVDLLTHITAGNSATTERITSYTNYFHSKGIGLFDAHQKAMKLIDMVVVKQSTLLSYLDSYLLIGLLFAIALPLLLLVIKRNKQTPNIIISDH